MNKQIIKENDVDEIIPNLWLGNLKSSSNKNFIDQYKIKNIMSVMNNHHLVQKYDNINYLTIPIRDKYVCDINLNKMLNYTCEYISDCLKNKNPILIHCKNGHHRSGVIVAAFLIKYLNMDYISAVKYINNIRPLALRRDTCMNNHLFEYSEHLKNKICKNKKCNINGYFYCCCLDN